MHGIIHGSKQNIHSSAVLRKDCYIAIKAICLSNALLVTRAVVGGWKKSLVLSIQMPKPLQGWLVNLLTWLPMRITLFLNSN